MTQHITQVPFWQDPVRYSTTQQGETTSQHSTLHTNTGQNAQYGPTNNKTQHNTPQHNATQLKTTQRNAMQHNTAQRNTT